MFLRLYRHNGVATVLLQIWIDFFYGFYRHRHDRCHGYHHFRKSSAIRQHMYPNAIARRTNAATARGVAIDSGITIYSILNLVLVLVECYCRVYPYRDSQQEHDRPQDAADDVGGILSRACRFESPVQNIPYKVCDEYHQINC